MFHQQSTHLPAMAHLFDHHASNRFAVPIRGRALKQMPLLLDAGELSIALIDNQIDQRITYLLGWHLAQVVPLAAALEGAELNFLCFNRAVERVEFEICNLVVIDADLFAPIVKHSDPITEGSDFCNSTWHKSSSIAPINSAKPFSIPCSAR